jgi:hypothetical protein
MARIQTKAGEAFVFVHHDRPVPYVRSKDQRLQTVAVFQLVADMDSGAKVVAVARFNAKKEPKFDRKFARRLAAQRLVAEIEQVYGSRLTKADRKLVFDTLYPELEAEKKRKAEEAAANARNAERRRKRRAQIAPASPALLAAPAEPEAVTA